MDIGRERLEVTVNHVLGVNESLAYKRSKLKTFTYKTSTQRQTKTKEKKSVNYSVKCFQVDSGHFKCGTGLTISFST